MTKFTHIHLHSEYSLLDGAIQFNGLIEHLKDIGMDSVACTDHGFMGGLVEFYKKCKKAEIKPLLGVEAYVTFDRDNKEEQGEQKQRDNLHMVLIAKDMEGLRKLYKLQTEAAVSNFYYKPRINFLKLEELSGHVVATSACLNGIIAGASIFHRNEQGIVQHIEIPKLTIDNILYPLKEWFGEDFYLEIQDWDDETKVQSRYNQAIIALARQQKIPLVITADCHYLKQEDHYLHEIMIAMQLKTTLEEYREKDVMRYGPNFYVKSPAEMIKSAEKWMIPEAINNTQKIVEKCNVELELGTYYLPEFKVEEAEDYEEFKEWVRQKKLTQ